MLRAKEAGAFPPASGVNPAVTRRCDALLARMLAPDPADRHPSYDDLIGEIDEVGMVGEGVSLAALAESVAEPATAPGPRLRVLLVYDESDYVPLVQHTLYAAEIPHDLSTVEDGHQAPATVARARAVPGFEPDVLLMALTSPTQASLRVMAEVRRGAAGRAPLEYGLSTSPDGAALIRGLGLGTDVWVTGFGNLKPLSDALRSLYEGVVTQSQAPPHSRSG